MFPLGDRIHESPEAAVATYRAELVELEASIADLRRRQVQRLVWLRGCTATLDNGSRSMHEWIRAEVDVSARTARDLMRVVDFTFDDHYPRTGDIASFDRMVALAGLAAAGANLDDIDSSADRDISAIDDRASHIRRMSRASEQAVARRRHLRIEPTMGNTAWRISGIAPAVDGDVIRRALQTRGDELATGAGPDERRPDPGQRMLDALTTLAFDYLDPQDVAEGDAPADGTTNAAGEPPIERTGDERGRPTYRPRRAGGTPLASVTVFVDADVSNFRGYGSGTYVAAGPRVGPETFDRIVCDAWVNVVGLDRFGNPTAASARSRTIPTAIRSHVLYRDGGCVIAGCRSRYRLEPHHVVPRSEGGKHTPDNLVTLCWYHHHIAIHHDGRRIDPESPARRRRFLPASANRHRAPPTAA